MSNNLLKAVSGYIASNAISKIVINDLRRNNEEVAHKLKFHPSEEIISTEIAKFILANEKQKAYEYLNAHFNEEIIDFAQNQGEYIYSLETLIQKSKNKYIPFYQRIETDMPEQLQAVTADRLCEILGVKNLHIIDSIDGETSPSKPNDEIGCSTIFCAIMLIGMIILMFVLEASKS